MIARPLELASKLRPPPRSFDAWFFVNGALIVLFFFLFGSRFVLAPGVRVKLVLPEAAGAIANARATTHHVTVVNDRQIFAGDGLRDLPQLQQWLKEQAKTVDQPTLLILSHRSVAFSLVIQIAGAASAAGFDVQVAAREPEGGGAKATTLK